MGNVLPPDDDTGRGPGIVLIVTAVVAVLLIVLWLWTSYGVGMGQTQVGDRVLFIGSSTIERFPLAELFPGESSVNLGVGNENTLQLRERLARVLASEVQPDGIVVYAGSADLRSEPGLPASEIRKRVEAVVQDLQTQFDAPTVLLEVLPARNQTEEERSALGALNGELANLARERHVTFVRTNRPPLTDANGDLVESMTTDRHHLNSEGYRVLAQWIIEDGARVGALLR